MAKVLRSERSSSESVGTLARAPQMWESSHVFPVAPSKTHGISARLDTRKSKRVRTVKKRAGGTGRWSVNRREVANQPPLAGICALKRVYRQGSSKGSSGQNTYHYLMHHLQFAYRENPCPLAKRYMTQDRTNVGVQEEKAKSQCSVGDRQREPMWASLGK